MDVVVLTLAASATALADGTRRRSRLPQLRRHALGASLGTLSGAGAMLALAAAVGV